MSSKKLATVVIPCMNEEKTLPSLISQMRKKGYRLLVPIAKRSSDGTRKVCENAGVEHFMDSGRGKGCAISESVWHVKTPFLVFFDGDGSHEISDIAVLLDRMEKTGADLVLASRLTGGSMELYDGTWDGFFRSFFTLCINHIINVRFGSRITDAPNGFRAGRTEKLRQLDLRSSRYEVEVEMIMKALKRGMKIEECPSREYPRVSGTGGLSVAWDGMRYIWIVFSNLI